MICVLSGSCREVLIHPPSQVSKCLLIPLSINLLGVASKPALPLCLRIALAPSFTITLRTMLGLDRSFRIINLLASVKSFLAMKRTQITGTGDRVVDIFVGGLLFPLHARNLLFMEFSLYQTQCDLDRKSASYYALLGSCSISTKCNDDALLQDCASIFP